MSGLNKMVDLMFPTRDIRKNVIISKLTKIEEAIIDSEINSKLNSISVQSTESIEKIKEKKIILMKMLENEIRNQPNE